MKLSRFLRKTAGAFAVTAVAVLVGLAAVPADTGRTVAVGEGSQQDPGWG